MLHTRPSLLRPLKLSTGLSRQTILAKGWTTKSQSALSPAPETARKCRYVRDIVFPNVAIVYLTHDGTI